MDLESAILSRIGITLGEHYDNLVRFWAQEKLKFEQPIDFGQAIDYPILTNEVHDELCLDSPEKDMKWLPEALKYAMEEAPTLRGLWPATKSLRLKVDIGVGPSWAGT